MSCMMMHRSDCSTLRHKQLPTESAIYKYICTTYIWQELQIWSALKGNGDNFAIQSRTKQRRKRQRIPTSHQSPYSMLCVCVHYRMIVKIVCSKVAAKSAHNFFHAYIVRSTVCIIATVSPVQKLREGLLIISIVIAPALCTQTIRNLTIQ